jgi:hypothetical protein
MEGKQMDSNIRIVSPGNGRIVAGEKGERLEVPEGWEFCPSGDAGVTRKITSKKNYWRVEVPFKRRKISKGVWAPKEIIEWAKSETESARAADGYKKKREATLRRRETKQAEYVEDFNSAVRGFLSFDVRYKDIEAKLADAVTSHATPVGSGTVARTERIPVTQRAESAVIAWLRHQTTAYDSMKIPRIKGQRREVRRMLAEHSRRLLEAYRRGDDIRDRVLIDALSGIPESVTR